MGVPEVGNSDGRGVGAPVVGVEVGPGDVGTNSVGLDDGVLLGAGVGIELNGARLGEELTGASEGMAVGTRLGDVVGMPENVGNAVVGTAVVGTAVVGVAVGCEVEGEVVGGPEQTPHVTGHVRIIRS